ncbi:MAG TPA: SAM-dependent methyltransferase [Kribbella sp.]|nr:SAM-dependent methyltransferase [Kribbella sp.]
MATTPNPPAPSGVNPNVPNGARIYDAMLGGKDNFAVDRAAVEQMLKANPMAPRTARANRDFLGRAVRYLGGECGIQQFLDIGTGLPTVQNVHEVALEQDPEAKVVYVDYDPVVVTHGKALLAGSKTVEVIQGDLRRPSEVLAAAGRSLDLSQPVAVLLVAILHFISDDENPQNIVREFREAMAPGSYLVISHTADESAETVMGAAKQGFKMAGAPLTPRSRAQISALFEGFELVDPGLVDVRQWRPVATAVGAELQELPWTIVGGVGRRT